MAAALGRTGPTLIVKIHAVCSELDIACTGLSVAKATKLATHTIGMEVEGSTLSERVDFLVKQLGINFEDSERQRGSRRKQQQRVRNTALDAFGWLNPMSWFGGASSSAPPTRGEEMGQPKPTGGATATSTSAKGPASSSRPPGIVLHEKRIAEMAARAASPAKVVKKRPFMIAHEKRLARAAARAAAEEATEEAKAEAAEAAAQGATTAAAATAVATSPSALMSSKGPAMGAALLLNEGADCWDKCNNRQGACPTGFCGAQGVCCREDFANSPSECGSGKAGCHGSHCCTMPVREVPHGFSADSGVMYEPCPAEFPHKNKGGRYCCQSPTGCATAEMHRMAKSIEHTYKGKMLAGCCVMQPEILNGTWRPSCESTAASAKLPSYPPARSPFVILSIAICSQKEPKGPTTKCVYNHRLTWRLFVGTLRAVYSGDVIVYVGTTAQKHVHKYARQQRIYLSTVQNVKNIVVERMLWFSSACSKPYRWCLAVDFRDSFFQGDPFGQAAIHNWAQGAQVVVQQEASPRTIGQEPYNTAWVGHCFGAGTLRRIAGERPVCGGGIAATPLGMRALKDAFCRLLWRRVNDQNRVCNDQGILNYLAYAGGDNNHAARGGVSWLVQKHGARDPTMVNHIGGIYPKDKVREIRDTAGYVLDDDGLRSAVVHQWDRFKELKNFSRELAGICTTYGFNHVKCRNPCYKCEDAARFPVK